MDKLAVPDSAKAGKPKKHNWFVPIIIAFIVAFWSVTIALFFLLIVFAWRLNPKSDLSDVITVAEKKICETNYRWLRNSSFITIPVFFIALIMGRPPAIAALIPFVFHISLLRRLNTESLYVYRHTQQALLLLLVRAAAASLIFSTFYGSEGFWAFVIVNGSLWLFSTNWEISQVMLNRCWLMEHKGEKITFFRAIESDKPDTLMMDKELAGMLDSLNADSLKVAKDKALHAFQSGTPAIKKRAVAVLTKLGEVEKF
jgi:hypothetical protein